MKPFTTQLAEALGPHFVFAVSSVKSDGNLSFRYAEANGQAYEEVVRARLRFLLGHSVHPQCVCAPSLAHGTEAIDVNLFLGEGVESPPYELTADLMSACGSGMFAGYLVADCAVVAIAAPGRELVVSGHIGWRSISTAVPALKAQAVRLGIPLSEAVTVIGPCQHMAYMERIGPDLDKPEWEPYIGEANDGLYPVNIHQRLRDALERNGLAATLIVSDRQNPTDPDLWSHAHSVKNGLPEGRTMMVVGYK